MKTSIPIDSSKILTPPGKVMLMYKAVQELITDGRSIVAITVAEIAKKAGIGKGTVYEYFDSKEELIAHAMMYDYIGKIYKLAEVAFKPENFQDRCYRIMDWIYENREYNIMFSQLIKSVTESKDVMTEMPAKELGHCDENEFEKAVKNFILDEIDKFMEEGYQQGAFEETDQNKRALALLSSMVQYAFVVMGSEPVRFSKISEQEAREFAYHSLVSTLGRK